MITLHGFGKYFGITDPSPPVLKVDCYMRMANINFTFNSESSNLKLAPKGKLPFINDDGKVIPDSQFILEHLKEHHANIDQSLTKAQLAQAYLITKSLDENLYFCLAYSRWICDDTWPIIKQAFFGALPPVIRSIVPSMVRNSIKKVLFGQGLTKHSHDEILHITKQSFIALSNLLDEQKYFFGDNPSSLDAAVYGMLLSFIGTDIKNDFNSMAKEFPNLVVFCDNINNKYYKT